RVFIKRTGENAGKTHAIELVAPKFSAIQAIFRHFIDRFAIPWRLLQATSQHERPRLRVWFRGIVSMHGCGEWVKRNP
ncbi:MAG: hypothetical protein AB1813_11220, partial [Verrucomicrobiota bacterium]